jgi:hypothetical protein
MLAHFCNNCESNWTAGEFDPGCAACGGGALERGCVICNGKCGQNWKKAIQDSNDSGEAHWVGKCDLPVEEQMQHIRRRNAG